jgi:hypothetical protein
MPVKKIRLSPAEKARYLEHVQELQSAGIECDIPEEMFEHRQSLRIDVAPPSENILYELPNGVAAYAIQVYLVALRGNLILRNFAISSEWGSDLVALSANSRGLYSVGPAFEFAANEVLNPRFDTGMHFRRRGDIAEGWLVASSLQPIPDKYPNRIMTELTLTFTDQFGQPHSAQAQAVLERSARRKGRRTLRSRSMPIGIPPINSENVRRGSLDCGSEFRT